MFIYGLLTVMMMIFGAPWWAFIVIGILVFGRILEDKGVIPWSI